MIGLNAAGAEFETGWAYPDAATYLPLYTTAGVNLFRLPFKWERMQPTKQGALDTVELGKLKAWLAAAPAKSVIIDLHNYGRRDGTITTAADLADFWRKMATAVKDIPSLLGYDLMNEPHSMGGTWKGLAQSAVNAIREVDKVHTICAGGDGYSGAHSWLKNNADFLLNDPAGNIVYQAHQYCDHDSAGKYSLSYDEEGAYPMVGVDRLKPWVGWLRQHNVKGFLGEFGVPSSDERWLVVLKNMLDYLKTEGIDSTAWAGGRIPSSSKLYLARPGVAPSKAFEVMKPYFAAAVTPPSDGELEGLRAEVAALKAENTTLQTRLTTKQSCLEKARLDINIAQNADTRALSAANKGIAA